jgi:hypothetical protein
MTDNIDDWASELSSWADEIALPLLNTIEGPWSIRTETDLLLGLSYEGADKITFSRPRSTALISLRDYAFRTIARRLQNHRLVGRGIVQKLVTSVTLEDTGTTHLDRPDAQCQENVLAMEQTAELA